jgi:acetylornithine/succinyldiaminopimelate/putrescine aminotransferase
MEISHLLMLLQATPPFPLGSHFVKTSWVEEVLLPSMGAEEAEAAARSAHVWTAAKGLRS